MYLDPFYDYARYQQRREDRLRAEARTAQSAALKSLLPTLTDDQLRAVLNTSDIKRQFITFVPGAEVDALLLGELAVRRAAAQSPLLTAEQVRARDLAAERAAVQEALASVAAGDLYAAGAIFGALQGQPARVSLPIALGVGPLNAAVLSASIQTELVQPVNDAALRNQANAQGIQRELVHERADP